MATPVAVGHTLTPQEAQAMGWSSGSYSPAPQQPPAQAPTNTPPQYTPPPAGTPSNVPTYGSTFYSPQTGQAQGTNQFDPNTGEPLNQPTQPSESTTPTSPEEDTINANQAMMDKWMADLDARSNQFQETMNQYINGSVPLSAGEQAQVDGLTQQYKALIDQQKLTNTGASGVANIRGYQTGAAEYDPMFQAKTIGAIVTAGINKVADLNTKMASSVAALTEQFKKDDMAAIKSAWDEYQDYSEKRTDAIQKTIDKAQAKIKEYNDKQEKITDEVSQIAIEAKQGGADGATMAKILGSKNLAEAIANSGDYLRKPNTEIVKLGDNQAYLIDKNTGKIIKSFGSGGGTGGVGGAGGVGGKSPYAGIVNTILASGKFTKDQSNAIRNAIENGEDPLTVIKNNAKNIMGQTEATTITKYETAKSALEDLQHSLNEFYANGGDTGIFKGNYEKTINKLGQVDNPALVDLATQIQTQLQVYRNAVSGTAYSAQEGADIASIFPGINKTEGLNQAILKGRMSAFDSTIDGAYKSTLGNAYSNLKSLENSTGLTKGTMSDRDFVAKAFVGYPQNYQEVVNATPEGQIPVVDNATGQIGYILPSEFNSSKYTYI